jgi:hypothetical protein
MRIAGKNVPDAKAKAHATICVIAPGGFRAINASRITL